MEAARLRLLQSREELEYRLVEAAVAASLTAADVAAAETEAAVATAATVANRDALMDLLRRGEAGLVYSFASVRTLLHP